MGLICAVGYCTYTPSVHREPTCDYSVPRERVDVTPLRTAAHSCMLATLTIMFASARQPADSAHARAVRATLTCVPMLMHDSLPTHPPQ